MTRHTLKGTELPPAKGETASNASSPGSAAVEAASSGAESALTYVVGIGASAGGLEAIERFFDHVPANCGLAFVIVQHLSPDFKSLMNELLARHTRLTIHRVEDGMAIQPNAIYLIPPKKNMVLSNGRLLLTDQEPKAGLNLPIDIFFRSLAQDMANRAVGVILSGTGSDGSRGIREIHEAGGLALVQDLDTASFDGMPRAALATGAVDLTLPPEEMPLKIIQYAESSARVPNQPSVTEVSEGDELTLLFTLLRRHYGVDFTCYKPSTIARRLERRLKLGNNVSFSEYLRRLETDSAEFDSLYRDLLVEVTQFFRDKEAFELIKTDVVPKLFERAAGVDDIRVWVPGCATGEEAYSLALLLHEYAAREKRRIDIKIFATDVHRASLELASNGVYSEQSVSEIPGHYLDRYFVDKRGQFAVSQELRQLVVFAPHNITKDPPFTKLDLISCRNVLIYLNQHAQRKVLSLFHFGLKTGGVLFLGPSESLAELEEEFEAIDRHWKLFRKRRDVRLDPGTRLNSLNTYSEAPFSLKQGPPGREPTAIHMPELGEVLLNRYMPPSLLLNERHELIHAFGDARNYLKVPEGRATADILKMVDGNLRMAITSALHRSSKEQNSVIYSRVQAVANDRECLLRVTVTPLAPKRGNSVFFLVCLEEEKAGPAVAPPPSESFDFQGESAARIGQLERELTYAKEHLQSTVEELETSNEELQATNEELVASNEELQSTNEELHSVNEELYTVNAEHQRKIEELTQLTADMDNLLHSTDIGTVFLDNELHIRKFTPAAAKVFNLLPQDIGRPLRHISNNIRIDHDQLVAEIERMVVARQPLEKEVETHRGEPFLMRIHPYLKETGVLGGTVLTFIDVSTIKEAERRVEAQERRLFVALKAGEICTWDWDIQTGNMETGTRFDQFFQLAPGSFGRGYNDLVSLIHPEDRQRFQARVAAALEGGPGLNIDHRVSLPGGETPFVTTRAEVYRDGEGKAVRMVGVCINTTGRHLMEKALRESEERLQAILDNSTAIIYAKDRQGRYVLANPQFLRLCGKSLNEVLGKTDDELFPPQMSLRAADHDQRVLESGAVVQTEEAFSLPDGVHTYLSVKFPLHDASAGVYGVGSISADITDRKRAEMEVHEGLQRRDRFLAMLSHELRNPLEAILNAATLLERSNLEPEIHGEALKVIERQTGQMARLLDDLLDVSRIAQNKIRFKKEVYDLSAIIREAVEVVRTAIAAAGLRLSVQVEEGPVTVLGDDARLQQMLVNLLTNAAKYTPRGGQIWLETMRDRGGVMIRVRDTGIGIRPEMLDRVFDLFVQADETLDRASGGMGVGLTLVRTIAEMHGGRVYAASAGINAGSEFSVWLPITEVRKTPPAGPESLPASRASESVLIVEDNADSRRMLEAMLRLDGFQVHVAANGEQGLEGICRLRPDIAILDIGLPGLNGYEIAKEVRGRLGKDSVYLIALTGYGGADDRAAVSSAGFDEHLVKPLKHAELSRILRQRPRRAGVSLSSSWSHPSPSAGGSC